MVLESMIQDVSRFHQAIGASVATQPTLLSHDKTACGEVAKELREVRGLCRAGITSGSDLLARVAMAVEELAECVEAHAQDDLMAAADAWGDRLYVLLGDAVAAGLPAADIFAEVHRSNMTKAISDAAGKGQKGDDFRKPQLAVLLQRPTHDSHESTH